MEAANIPADDIAYNSVINAHARSGQAREAETWLDKMTEARVKPTLASFNSVINAHGRSAQSSEAIRWLDRMEAATVKPDVISFTSAIVACMRCPWTGGEMTEQLFCRMLDQGVQPDDRLLTLLSRKFGGRHLSALHPHLQSRMNVKGTGRWPSRRLHWRQKRGHPPL